MIFIYTDMYKMKCTHLLPLVSGAYKFRDDELIKRQILGTLLQLEMLLIPQLQFAFPYNYMYLIVTILIMLCGFAMIWTVISEIGIIVQALLGDRRFTFRNDQHVLGGLIIGMLIIWLNLLVSTEVAISHVLFSPKQQTPALSASG
uniref:Uncharacterized protein n=1 Tax=Trichobilharzia regenti TaxID=157069 RepID=A0AA85J3X8_TRIRE|nr:unnamed protein product [Trichobilharzia regenti]